MPRAVNTSFGLLSERTRCQRQMKKATRMTQTSYNTDCLTTQNKYRTRLEENKLNCALYCGTTLESKHNINIDPL